MIIRIGFKQFGQITGKNGPVVHLHIDVVPVAAAPRAGIVDIPDALKIAWKSLFPRGTDQQITAVLKVEFLQITGFFSRFIFFQQKIGAFVRLPNASQIDLSSSEKVVIILQMTELEFLESEFESPVERLPDFLLRMRIRRKFLFRVLLFENPAFQTIVCAAREIESQAVRLFDRNAV